jgi:uncharacterized membrane protein YkgB
VVNKTWLTTPESWVPPLGDAHWVFPYLSGRGLLGIKDLVILGGALVTMSESARLYLGLRKPPADTHPFTTPPFPTPAT